MYSGKKKTGKSSPLISQNKTRREYAYLFVYILTYIAILQRFFVPFALLNSVPAFSLDGYQLLRTSIAIFYCY